VSISGQTSSKRADTWHCKQRKENLMEPVFMPSTKRTAKNGMRDATTCKFYETKKA